jgi:hypothetical protein
MRPARKAAWLRRSEQCAFASAVPTAYRSIGANGGKPKKVHENRLFAARRDAGRAGRSTPPNRERTFALLGPLIRLNPAPAAEATEQPEQYENKHHQAKNAAQPGPTVSTMSIIPSAATEQEDDDDYDQNCAHYSSSREILIAREQSKAITFSARPGPHPSRRR